MKKTVNEKKKLLKSAAKAMVTLDLTEWPPECIGFIYQPMRPSFKPKDKNCN